MSERSACWGCWGAGVDAGRRCCSAWAADVDTGRRLRRVPPACLRATSKGAGCALRRASTAAQAASSACMGCTWWLVRRGAHIAAATAPDVSVCSPVCCRFVEVLRYCGEELGMRVVVEPHDYKLLVRRSCAVGLGTQQTRACGWRVPARLGRCTGGQLCSRTRGWSLHVGTVTAECHPRSPTTLLHPRLQAPYKLEYVDTYEQQDLADLHSFVDFVVCLGGDGLLLHAASLLGPALPPVISFKLGSLGFLTTHRCALFCMLGLVGSG